MESPKKPSLMPDIVRALWRGITAGRTSEMTANMVAASRAAGGRWFRECGGMPSFMLTPFSGRYLSFVERVELEVCTSCVNNHP